MMDLQQVEWKRKLQIDVLNRRYGVADPVPGATEVVNRKSGLEYSQSWIAEQKQSWDVRAVVIVEQ